MREAKELWDLYCSHCPVVKLCQAQHDGDPSFNGIAAGRVYADKPSRARKCDGE